MILGILSDTHGAANTALAAVNLLRSRGAGFLIHCGDIGGEAVLDLLAGEDVLAVWGNTDDSTGWLARYARQLGVAVYDGVAEIELAGKRFAVTHGDDARLVRAVLDRQSHDYLLLGHTHVASDSRVGRTRVINPGALYRAARRTVALLDVIADGLEFVEVGRIQILNPKPEIRKNFEFRNPNRTRRKECGDASSTF
jgi:putative phosphoesterase